MKILLTGGRGMVGRNILEHPLAHGLIIHAPSRDELDLRDKSEVIKYIESTKPDLIIHAAGKVGGIKANMSMPYEFLVENLEIGTNVISAAERCGVTKLLNLGSSCIYPRDVDGLLTEDLILTGQLEPTNEGYALAKIVSLRLCEFITNKSNGFSYKTIIPCNLYGPYDKFELDSAHLIPAIINKVHSAKMGGEGTVEIWGDGSARREFMYVGDLVEVVLRSVRNFDSIPNIFNVGLGYDYSVLEYYKAVAEVVGWDGSFVFDLSKPVGMSRKLVDVSRQGEVGFRAGISLNVGIQKTYDYFVGSVLK